MKQATKQPLMKQTAPLLLAVIGSLLVWPGHVILPRRSLQNEGAAVMPHWTDKSSVHGSPLLAKLPVSFVENQGQWDSQTKFVARKGGVTASFEADGITVRLATHAAKESVQGVAIRLAFEGASEAVRLVGDTPQPGRFHYLLGNEPTKWHTNVPSYSQVVYHHLYDGIDLQVREDAGRLEYDVLLAPEADLHQVVIRAEGVDRLELRPNGALLMRTALGPITQHPPTTWYERSDGTRQPIRANFVLLDATHYSFEVPNRNPQLALVIDPGLEWSTFVGGSSLDQARALVVDPVGAVIIVGRTVSPNFPATSGAFNNNSTGFNQGTSGIFPADGFVAKLNASGTSLIWATFLGSAVPAGFGLDSVNAVAVNPATGEVVVAGLADNGTFPTTSGAYNNANTGYGGGNSDGFVAQLSADGSQLLASTFFGGSMSDEVTNLVLQPGGLVTVAGRTSSLNFPTTPGAYDQTFNGVPPLNDVFVAEFNPGFGLLAFSTFLGGASGEAPTGLALNYVGDVIVVGNTTSADFPTTPGAFDTTYPAFPLLSLVPVGFLARLSQSGSFLTYSTFLGNNPNTTLPQVTTAAGVVASPTSDVVTVAAATNWPNFPVTSGAYDATFNSLIATLDDALLLQLQPNLAIQPPGTQVVYATFLGGANDDRPNGLALDSAGTITIVGQTSSGNFPTTGGSYDTSLSGGTDAFVARLRPDPSLGGNQLVYATYLGGSDVGAAEAATAVALDATNAAMVGGNTPSVDFPIAPMPGAYDPSYNGNLDAFVARLDMLPAGVGPYGSSTSTCSGTVVVAGTVGGRPQGGNAAFGVTVTGAPPNSQALVVIGGGAASTPVAGVQLLVNPAQPFVYYLVSTDVTGFGVIPLPIPPGLFNNLPLYAQFLGFDASCGAFYASNGLAVTIP